MSLQTRLDALIAAIGADVKQIKTTPYANMVTTDSAQTISSPKRFDSGIVLGTAQPVHLKGTGTTGDINHSLVYDGVVDGPVLRGWSGGEIRTVNGTPKAVIKWDSSGTVNIGTGPLQEGGVRVYSPNNPPPAGGTNVQSTIRVRVSSFGDVPTRSGPQTVNGVALVAGDSVLLKDQITSSQNGVWVVQTGVWTRHTSADTSDKLSGLIAYSTQGATFQDRFFRSTFKPTDTLNTTAMTWRQVLDSSEIGFSIASLDNNYRIPVSQLGSGTANSTVYLRGDGSWAAPAGGGGGTGPALEAQTDYTTTLPSNPATGLKIYTRYRARRLPSFVGPTGVDSALQPALFTNRIGRYSAINATAALQADSLAAPTAYTTAATAVTLTTTNFYTALTRNRYASAATAAAFAGFRIANPQWFLSSNVNLGGFFWVFRFGINAGVANGRGFVGLSATNANEANANPNTLTNRIGFGFNDTSTNWYFNSAGATANATVTDLGTNFPARTYATNFYEFRLFAPATSGAEVYWSAIRLNDSFTVNGGPVTTNLPALNTLLTHHAWMNNNTTAAAVSLDVQSLYIETDN